MSLILNEKYIKGNNSYKLFITNRFLRIYPIYWTILILVVLMPAIDYVFFHGQPGGPFGAYIKYFKSMDFGAFAFLVFTNILLFFQDAVMFLGLDTSNGHLFFTSNFRQTNPQFYTFLFIPQAWTIGVELLFYVIAPFLVRKKIYWIIPLIFLSIGLRLFIYSHGLYHDPWTYRFFPTELVFFMLGIVSYHIYKLIRVKTINKILLNSGLVAIILFIVLYPLINGSAKYYIFLILFFISLPFIFYMTKKWKVDNFIGELSYPIYICHNFVLHIMEVVFKHFKIYNNLLSLLVSIVAILLFSFALNELIAKRIEKYRQRRFAKSMVAPTLDVLPQS